MNMVTSYCKWQLAMIVLILALLVSGCTVASNSNQEPMATISTTRIPAVEMSMITRVVTTTILSPTPTTEPTLAPATRQPTITLTPVEPTLTPLPTMSTEAATDLYYELYENNGDCQLPCWWGFEIGSASMAEVEQFYQSLNANIRYSSLGRILEAMVLNPNNENGWQVRHKFIAPDETIIHEMEIQIDQGDQYRIIPMLETWGEPTDIWLWTIPNSREGSHPARLRIYYPNHGILAAYSLEVTTIDDQVHICFDQIENITFLLWDPAIWDPEGTKTFTDRANESGALKIEDNMRPITEVTDWDVQTFYEVATNVTATECMLTPAELWPIP
ncbi:MAG TPA: hypothetical protein VLL52_22045 [Anaerolineae bacterium]|nr:hypothetical protein [Anaerolineae bacterium]